MNTDLFGRPSALHTGERADKDFYPTPAFMTRSLLAHEWNIRGLSVLECCSGDGAIVHVLDAYGCTVTTNDIDAQHPAQTHHDATDPAYWARLGRHAWVITNPPFAVAFPILVQAYEHARMGVAFLLRKTFLEPTEERGPWLALHPPSRLIGQPRHAFRPGWEQDSVACDWYVWRKFQAAGDPIVIDHLAKRRIRNEVDA